MKWDDIKIALAVHRTGTLVGAGKALGMDPTTVGRRLGVLEAALGHTLFERGAKSLIATSVGQSFFEGAVGMEEAVAAATRRLASQDQSLTGEVRLTTVATLFTHYLLPRLSDFRTRHPGISLNLLAGTEQVNLAYRDADLAIRMVRPEAGDVFIRRVARIGYAVYASRTLVAEQGCDPANLPWIRHEARFRHLPEVVWAEAHYPKVAVSAQTTVGAMMAAAAESGLGAAILPCYLAQYSSQLIALSEVVLLRDAWLMVHRDMRHIPRIRVLADWLADTLAEDAALLAGDARP